MDKESQAQYQKFLDHFSVKYIDKGEMLLFQGEVPKAAFVLKKGVIKAYNLTDQGDEKPVAFFVAGDVIPPAWVFQKAQTTLYFCESVTPSELYTIPREKYLELVSSNPAILMDLLGRFVRNYTGMTMRLNALQYSKASDKLIYTLHYLMRSYGREVGESLVEIGLPLTQQDFANLTGLTRETTAVELYKLKKQGIINYEKQKPYQIWTNKLNSMLSDQFLAELELEL